MSLLSSFTGSIPDNYDRHLGPFLFEPYAKDLAGRLQQKKLQQVLEIACGTGRLTRQLLPLLPPGGTLTATDLNADMIATAKSLVPGTVHWQVADAQSLPFPEKTFDAVVCQFGVMFFPNKATAFAESYRVLKPNSTFLFNTWDELRFNPVSDFIRRTIEEVLRDQAPDFFMKGPFSLFDKDELNALMKGAGFKDTTLDVVPITVRCDSAESIINGFVKGTPLDAYLANLEPSLRQSLEKRLQEGFVAAFGERDILMPMQALVCEGHR